MKLNIRYIKRAFLELFCSFSSKFRRCNSILIMNNLILLINGYLNFNPIKFDHNFMDHLSQIPIFFQTFLKSVQAVRSMLLSYIFKTKIIDCMKDFLITILRMMIYLDSLQHWIFSFNAPTYYLVIIIFIISHYFPFFQVLCLQSTQKTFTKTINQSFSYFYSFHYYLHEELKIDCLSFYQSFSYYY